MKICYHGTSGDNVTSILKHGFWERTWFARHLEDAIAFGGSHIFQVCFANPPDDWQFMVPERIPPAKIVSYQIHQVETMFENKKLRKSIFESNLR